MLVPAEGRDFTRRPARHQGVAALGDLPFDEITECVFSDTAPRKGGYERRNRAENHELVSVSGSFGCTVGPVVQGLIRSVTARCPACGVSLYFFQSCCW